jgi:hypothetical protein
MYRILYSLILSCTFLSAQDKEALAEPQGEASASAKPNITRLENGSMQIGEIIFDPKTRQIRVPCSINMTEGLLEFALVHQNGKIHESLLITTASPLHANIAMKMLRYTPSPELYYIEKEKGVSSGKFPKVEEETSKAARINLFVEFDKEGKKVTLPLRDLILNEVTQKSMETDEWIYGGSLIYDGKFYAETSGDFASIFVSRGSLILYAGKNNENDEVWSAHTKRLPEVGTKATLIIEPITSSPTQKK